MNQPTDKQKQEALTIAIEAEREFMAAKDDVGKYRPKQTTALALSIATALSSRDQEIREVLEGLMINAGCWCRVDREGHTADCLATQRLWNKLNP